MSHASRKAPQIGRAIVIFCATALLGSATAAQGLRLGDQMLHFCVPPPEPILDEDYLEAYGTTRGEEMTVFYTAAQAYLNCLEASQKDYMVRLNELIKAQY